MLFGRKRVSEPRFGAYAPNLTIRRARIDLDRDARREGQDDRPKQNDTELNAAQQLVLDHFCSEHDRLNERVVADLGTSFGRIQSYADHPGMLGFDAVLSGADVEIQRRKLDTEANLRPLSKTELQARKDLKAFKQEHHRSFNARYPDSKIYHFALIVSIVVAESLANMYFFAQGNELGFLGGFFQSLLLSCSNVGAAVLVGVFGLPQIHHRSVVRRVLGCSSLVAFVAFLVCFNLLAAHYRDQLSIDAELALQKALQAALDSPFGLTFDSLMLVVVGVLAASTGLYKGYTADDPYPGYGRQYREHAVAARALDSEKNRARELLLGVFDDIKKQCEEAGTASATRVSAAHVELLNITRTFEIHDAARSAIEKECTRVLKSYRQINASVREAPVPNYFSSYPGFDTSLSIAAARDSRMKIAEQQIERCKDQHTELSQRISAIYDGLAEQIRQVAVEMDVALEKIVEDAAAEIAKDLPTAK